MRSLSSQTCLWSFSETCPIETFSVGRDLSGVKFLKFHFQLRRCLVHSQIHLQRSFRLISGHLYTSGNVRIKSGEGRRNTESDEGDRWRAGEHQGQASCCRHDRSQTQRAKIRHPAKYHGMFQCVKIDVPAPHIVRELAVNMSRFSSILHDAK